MPLNLKPHSHQKKRSNDAKNLEPRRSIQLFEPYISPEAIDSIAKVITSPNLPYGSVANELESDFKEFFDFRFPVAVSSGTAAIHLALRAAGVGLNDEVITTPMTCVATNMPILEQGAIPVFADVQQFTGNIDPQDVEKKITARTKAIVCVDLAGYPCDLDELRNISKNHQIVLIEDAAQALSATYKNTLIGQISPFTCFSFGRSKHVASGSGGLVVTEDERFVPELQKMRFYGFDPKDAWPRIGHPSESLSMVGYRYDLDNINAALIRTNLRHIYDNQVRRQFIANEYRRALTKIPGISSFRHSSDRTSANWVYMVHVEKRERFTKHLSKKGIQTWVMFTRNDLYTAFGGQREDLPGLERFERTYSALPCHSNMTDDQLEFIIRSIGEGW